MGREVNCTGHKVMEFKHKVLEFKSNLAIGLLGGNLLGIAGIGAAVAWAMLSGIPDMEKRLATKIETTNEKTCDKVDEANIKTAKMESRLVALEQVADIYLKDLKRWR